MIEKKILFVDDDKAIREMLFRAFANSGYTVRLAASAEEALDILKKEQFHVMFLDLQMPGMDGVELCRKIRREWPLAITYALTAYASLFDLSDCRKAGFEDYFTKPVTLKTLFTAADNAFEKLDRWQVR